MTEKRTPAGKTEQFFAGLQGLENAARDRAVVGRIVETDDRRQSRGLWQWLAQRGIVTKWIAERNRHVAHQPLGDHATS